jgi:hypothetical protein
LVAAGCESLAAWAQQKPQVRQKRIVNLRNIGVLSRANHLGPANESFLRYRIGQGKQDYTVTDFGAVNSRRLGA